MPKKNHIAYVSGKMISSPNEHRISKGDQEALWEKYCKCIIGTQMCPLLLDTSFGKHQVGIN